MLRSVCVGLVLAAFFAGGPVQSAEREAKREAGEAFLGLIAGPAAGSETVLAHLHQGSVFGEMALVSARPRNATVTTTTPVRVLVVNEPAFRRLLRDSPQIQLKVLQTLADRAAETALH